MLRSGTTGVPMDEICTKKHKPGTPSLETRRLYQGGSGILSLAGNKISLNLRRQERNFRNPQVLVAIVWHVPNADCQLWNRYVIRLYRYVIRLRYATDNAARTHESCWSFFGLDLAIGISTSMHISYCHTCTIFITSLIKFAGVPLNIFIYLYGVFGSCCNMLHRNYEYVIHGACCVRYILICTHSRCQLRLRN